MLEDRSAKPRKTQKVQKVDRAGKVDWRAAAANVIAYDIWFGVYAQRHFFL